MRTYATFKDFPKRYSQETDPTPNGRGGKYVIKSTLPERISSSQTPNKTSEKDRVSDTHPDYGEMYTFSGSDIQNTDDKNPTGVVNDFPTRKHPNSTPVRTRTFDRIRTMPGPRRDSKPASNWDDKRYPTKFPYVRNGPSKIERSTYDSAEAVLDPTTKRKLKPYAYSSSERGHRADDRRYIRKTFSDRNHATVKTHGIPFTGQYSHKYPNNETATCARGKGKTLKRTNGIKKLNQFPFSIGLVRILSLEK